ncbi:MAG TPA: Spo0E family sporulation regulatory protein-aspartic acid phosphatase [Clostridia bacterium]|jgi:hypothetical protein|nr:Spo0E family sporulation regulatory protein-aspartic acid phosphatase [Clostridia bacterium]
MIEVQIRELQKELNLLIDQDADYAHIYEVSVRLDHLIARYYYEKMNIEHIS